MITSNIIARAVELARTGQFNKKTDIAKQLVREGYERVNQHLDAKSVGRLIRTEIVKARDGDGTALNDPGFNGADAAG